jgi:hypothetical protein
MTTFKSFFSVVCILAATRYQGNDDMNQTKWQSRMDMDTVFPQQCSVCRSGAFKFVRLVPCSDVRYEFHVKSMFDSSNVLFISFVFISA